MQMLQKKKVGAGLALIAAIFGVSSSAFALPEMDVDTLPPIAAPQSVGTVDSAVAEPEEVDAQDSVS
jgi:hypothetical protein